MQAVTPTADVVSQKDNTQLLQAQAGGLTCRFPQPEDSALPRPSLLGHSGTAVAEAQRLVAESSFSAEPGSEAFQPLLRDLVVEEARCAMRAVEAAVCRRHVLDQRLPGLAGNAREQKRLQSQKQAERKRAEERLATLSAWLKPDQGDFVSLDCLPHDVQLAQQAAQGGWSLQEVLDGSFPWHAATGAGAEASLQVSLLLHRISDAEQAIERCDEELALLAEEKAATLAACSQRVGQLEQLASALSGEAEELARRAARAPGAGDLAGPSSGEGPAQAAPAQEAGQLLQRKRIAEGKQVLVRQRLRGLRSLQEAAASAFALEDPEEGLCQVRFEVPLCEGDALYDDESGAAHCTSAVAKVALCHVYKTQRAFKLSVLTYNQGANSLSKQGNERAAVLLCRH